MIKPATWFVLRVLAALTAAATIIIAAATYRLSQGPVSLAFLTPYLEDAMRYGRSDLTVQARDTVLTWGGWDRTLDIRTLDVSIRRADGTVIASAPEVSLGLSVRAMLERRLVPTTIDIIGVKARLSRDETGRFSLGFSSDDKQKSFNIADFLIAELLPAEGGLAKDGNQREKYLRRISITDADLTIDDRASGTVWEASQADLVLTRDRQGVAGSLDFGLALEGGPARISVQGRYDVGSDRVPLSIRLTDLYAPALALKSNRLMPLAGVDVEVSGSVDLVLDRNSGKISSLGFDLSSGPGLIDMPEFYIDNLRVDKLALKGAFIDGFTTVRVDNLYVNAGDPVVEMNGLVKFPESWSEGRPSLDLEGEVRNLPVNDLGKFWPPVFAPRARDWVTTNIRGGTITQATARINLSGGVWAAGRVPRDAVKVDFKFRGLRVDYLRPMTRMTRANGSARLTADDLDLVITRARVGNLSLSEGTLRITGFAKKITTADIGVVVSGSVRDSLALVDQEPLRLASRLKIKPEDVGGRAATRLKITLPLKKTIALDDVKVVAASNLAEASMPGMFGGLGLADGNLLLKVDRARMSVDGTARIGGIPTRFSWREEFDRQKPFPTRYKASGVMSDRDRERLALSAGGRVSGPLPFVTDIKVDPKQGMKGRVQIDLRQARINLPELPWQKPSGAPGELNFDLAIQGDGRTMIPAFEFSGPDLTAQGQAEISGGRMQRLDITRLKYAGNDISASVRPQAPDGYIVAIEGANFDLRPYIARMVSGNESNAPPPLRVSGRLKRLVLSTSVFLTDVTAEAVYDGKQWSALSGTGNIGGKAKLNVQLTTYSSRRLFRITSPDAGEVGRATGIFTNGVGGRLELNARIKDDISGTPVTGDLRVYDLRVVNAPVLARIFTLGSLTGIRDLLTGEGVLFTRTVVPFEWTVGTIKVKDARAIGTVGVTLNGEISTLDDTVNLEGTIIPAYTLNSVLGNIPILGTLLVGKKGEGVFGLTYGVAGPVDNPKVFVNPLSALAPGILRNMFRFGKQTAAPAEESSNSNER